MRRLDAPGAVARTRRHFSLVRGASPRLAHRHMREVTNDKTNDR
jgi:hypothetical protein